MRSNIFDRDYWLDWENWNQSIEDAQKIADGAQLDAAGWIGTWMENIDTNMSRIYCEYDFIADEYGMHDGPVLVCGAGPSLSRNIESVKKAHEKYGLQIIAVDRAFKTLREVGIRPFYTVAADASPITRSFLDGYDDADNFAFSLVCDKNMGDIVLNSSGVKWFGNINPFSGFWQMMYYKYGREMACVRSGSVVTFNAVDIALWMGFNPILTIGNELSFTTKDEALEYVNKYNPQPIQQHKLSGRWIIKAFGDAAGNFSIFPCFHPDISFIDLSDGLCKYYNWQVGEFNIPEKECA